MTSRARQRALSLHRDRRAADIRRRANAGTWDGRRDPITDLYFRSCVTDDGKTGTRLIFTRDIGHHTSGWFKNPDYERCYHLSMSSWDPTTGRPYGHLERSQALAWAAAVFGPHLQLAWIEPAASPGGKAHDVQHWRVFCDPTWQPIVPRGEVYSLDFTEKGWKTYSQVRAETGLLITSPLNPYAE